MGQYSQSSFEGGMNLLANDTDLQPNQYRIGFNVRNRYYSLQATLSSEVDPALPEGLIQEVITFGNYVITFVAGNAYYRYYTDEGWKQIVGFSMNSKAPRLWTVAVPVSTTNYYRLAADPTANSEVNLNVVAGASAGNLPGLLVQDNINQPQFIFLTVGSGGVLVPTSRITQTFSQWSITFTDGDNNVVAPNGDKREYVPIGNFMEYTPDGILYVGSPDGNYIYQSVTGRPLDFVRNVQNTLVTDAPYTQFGGGDATTTSYSVGVGPISSLRSMSDGSLFVGAANACFKVALNLNPNATKIFGEYPLTRTFLFNATCLSDRVMLDSNGDTRFIDLTGVRSFNAILQQQNEGRNSPFTATVQPAFAGPTEITDTDIVQDASFAAAILYNNYEFYAVTTVFGPAIAVYDSINNDWVSFDISQTGGKRIKKLVKIELTIQRLYAITEDDRLYTLYINSAKDSPTFRTPSIYSGSASVGTKLQYFCIVFDNITEDSTVSVTPFVDNRLTKLGTITKPVIYTPPVSNFAGMGLLPELNRKLVPVAFPMPSIEQGWKAFCLVTWTGNMTVNQFFFSTEDIMMGNSLAGQRSTQ